MKFITIVISLFFLFTNCSAQYYNEIVNKDHSPSNLKKDVDFVQHKLEKASFTLYRYISKKNLDHKFDSLKQTIKTPLNSIDFNVKLSGLLSIIGDGHLSSNIDVSKFTEADKAEMNKKNVAPVYQFGYQIINGAKLYIMQNYSHDSSILSGTEILSINHIPVYKILDSICSLIPSDGFNNTFKYFILNVGSVPAMYRYAYGYQDTTIYELKYRGITRKVSIKSIPFQQLKNIPANSNAKIIGTTYKFLNRDSSIAYIKISTFEDSIQVINKQAAIFKSIKQANAKTLILDLRGNTGGAINLTANFFSYLIDTPVYFFKRVNELTRGYIGLTNNIIRKQQIEWYKRYNTAAYVTPNKDSFKGKLYVLINGGTFSAAAMLTAHIKALKKAIFVGEETGGSSTEWTGGGFQNELLPTSKLLLRYGIIPLELINKDNIPGRGIMPDTPISYTIEDYIAKKDLELDWVLNDISKNVHIK
jgi:hypothetical protein